MWTVASAAPALRSPLLRSWRHTGSRLCSPRAAMTVGQVHPDVGEVLITKQALQARVADLGR